MKIDWDSLPDQNEPEVGRVDITGLPDTTPNLLRQRWRESRLLPDQAAEVINLSARTGLPRTTVERNLQEARRRAAAPDWDAVEASAPITARELAANFRLFELAADDTEALTAAERAYGVLKAPRGPDPDVGSTLSGIIQALPQGLERTRQGIRLQLADLFGFDTVREDATRKLARSQTEEILTTPRFESLTARGLYGGGTSLLRQAPGLAASVILRTPVPGLATAGLQTQAEAYGKYRLRGASPGQAFAGGVGEGAVEVGTELLPMKYLVDAFGKAGAKEFLTGLLAREIPSEQLATLAQDAIDTAIANPDKTWGEYVAERPGAAYQTLLATLVQSGSIGAVSYMTERLAARAERAVNDAAGLEQLRKSATASKLRQRDPEAFRQFVETAGEGARVDTVFIDARTLAEVLGQEGVPLEEITKRSPSVREQIEEAFATGDQVAIPVSEFAAHIAAEPYANALLPHLRTDPEGMSQAEAQAFFQDGPDGEQLRREVEAAVNPDAPLRPVMTGPQQTENQPPAGIDAVIQSVLGQLQQANRFTPDVNQAYADLVGAIYNATAGRLGVSPEQLSQEFPLNIVSQLLLGPQVLAQNTQAPIAGQTSLLTGASPSAPAANPAAGPDVLNQEPGRRRGAFDPSTRTIALLEHADLSTFLHEVSHWYLEVLTDLAARPDAPAEIRADMDTTLRWFGIADLPTWRGMTLDQKRPFHEMFARGFEAYAFEGEAPSLELAGVFQRFRAWLLRVYRNLLALKVTLNDEVRAVFGRMVATDEQIRTAEAARSFAPLFDSAQAAGMTPEEFAIYQGLGREATMAAVDNLERRSLRDMRWLANAKSRKLKELQRDAAAKRAAVRAEVAAELSREPVYAAHRFLSRGELPEGRQLPDGMSYAKLSLPALKEMYGDGPAAPWRYLSTGQYGLAATEGLPPDLVATLFGFTSGDHLVRALLAMEKVGDVTEALTDQRMLERYGDLVNPELTERAAEAAIHNDVRARFLEREVNQLARATGNRPLLLRAARVYAEQATSRRRIREIRPGAHKAAESKAGREAEAAFKAGDTAKAAVQKRTQLLQHELHRASLRAQDEVDAGIAFLRRFGAETVRRAIGADYADQVDQLLERHDFRVSVSNRDADRRASLLEWVEQQRAMGFEPAIDESLLREAQRQPFREMTLESFRGLIDAVRNIEHLGRLKQRLLTIQDQRALDRIVEEAAASINQHATSTRRLAIETNLPQDRAGKLLEQFLVGHRKLASIVRQMDGGKDGGTMWGLLVRGMNRAGDQEAVQREQATVRLTQLFTPLMKQGGLYRKTYIPEIGTSLTRMGRLMVALNWGNETNRQRIMDGDGWTQAQAEAVLRTLTPADWNFVEGVWRYLDSYWPAIAAKEQRVSGIAPGKVEASPFTISTPSGTRELTGGYFPIKYDPNRSSRAQADNLAEVLRQSMHGLYTRATTRRGHTKARVDTVNRPVRKDFGVIFEHVDQVIHDLAWHEWLIDATRLLRAKPIEGAIRAHYGPEVLRTMSASLEDIAKGDIPAQNAWEAAINHLRAGVTIAGMGWNLMTSLMQPLGLTQSIVRIGPKWVGRGLARWIGDAARMESTVRGIYERSDFMRLRGKTLQREISEIRNKVTSDGSKLSAVRESYFWFITRAQMLVDVPTWLGAYEKAIAEAANEAKAVALADQAVLDSQGGGQIKDLAAVQRGSPAWKLFTNFYSYFSTTYNLTAERVAATDFRSAVSIGRLAVDFLLLYTVPAVLGFAIKEAIRGGGDDDDELAAKLAREQLTYLLGTMVGVRELSAAVSGTFGYSGPAGTRFFSEATRLGTQVSHGEVNEAFLKALNGTAGVLFHYPAGQVQRTVEGVAAVTEGEAGPQAVLFGPRR